MGQEKGLVDWKGKSFLTWILEAVTPVSDKVFLVTKEESYRKYKLSMIPDIYENKGPVGGIYSALRNSKSKWNLILSCDIPKIKSDLLLELIESGKSNPSPITIASDGIYDYPLVGVYHQSLADEFGNATRENKLKLRALVDSFSPNRLVIEPENQPFLANVNSPEELENLT
jgi:molybdopterin-guanine dinucleotide biosynthesis protein A